MLNIKIAVRFMVSNKKRFISSTIIVLLATFVFYFVTVASAKLEEKLERLTTPLNGHLAVFSNFNQDQETLNMLVKELKEVDRNIQTTLYVNTFSVFNKKNNKRYIFKTFDLSDEYDFFEIKRSMALMPEVNQYPHYSDNQDEIPKIFMGFLDAILLYYGNEYNRETVYDLPTELGIGKVVSFRRSEYEEPIEFEISGKLFSDVSARRANFGFVDRQTAAEVFNIEGYNSLEIILKNSSKSNLSADKITSVLNKYLENYETYNWIDESEEVNNLIFIVKVSVFIIQLLTAFSIVFSLANIMSLATKDKMREIGILKTLGYTKTNLTKIFLTQTIIISLISVIFGLLIGFIFNNIFVRNVVHLFKEIPLIYLPTSYFNKYSLITGLAIIAFSLIGSYLPLRKVNKTEIIDIIKE